MQITVQLAPELEARLSAEAQARGLALEGYIVEKLSDHQTYLNFENPAVTRAIERMRVLREGTIPANYPIKDLVHEGHKY